MFEDHHAREIIRKLDEILERQEILRSDQLHFRDIFMASLLDVQNAQMGTTQAIQALSARVTAALTGVATAADLDAIVTTATANTAAINAIDPTTAPAA